MKIMYAGASINSKAPCHLYSSRLAGGRKICRSLPGRAFLYVMPEIQAGIHVFKYCGPLIGAFRGDDLLFCHA